MTQTELERIFVVAESITNELIDVLDGKGDGLTTADIFYSVLKVLVKNEYNIGKVKFEYGLNQVSFYYKDDIADDVAFSEYQISRKEGVIEHKEFNHPSKNQVYDILCNMLRATDSTSYRARVGIVRNHLQDFFDAMGLDYVVEIRDFAVDSATVEISSALRQEKWRFKFKGDEIED